jgi:hypothetical protein
MWGECDRARQNRPVDWRHHWAFFDNLHLLHHQRPAAHFSDYPSAFMSSATEQRTGHAAPLTLDLVSMSTHCMALWRRDIEGVGKCILGRPDDEASSIVWERTRPIGPPPCLVKSLRGTQRLARLDKFFWRVLCALGVSTRPRS